MNAREPDAWDRLLDTAAREAEQRHRNPPVVTRHAFAEPREPWLDRYTRERLIGAAIAFGIVGMAWAAPYIAALVRT